MVRPSKQAIPGLKLPAMYLWNGVIIKVRDKRGYATYCTKAVDKVPLASYFEFQPFSFNSFTFAASSF